MSLDLNKALSAILVGIVVLIFFLSTVGIIADKVFEATSATSNLTESQKSLLDLIPLIYVVVGIMIAVAILMRFTGK